MTDESYGVVWGKMKHEWLEKREELFDSKIEGLDIYQYVYTVK